jgi:L-aminopeptidase/D-esterase-like protein
MKQAAVICVLAFLATSALADERPRARDIGLVVGIFPTGELNAITDVDGVKVGHATIVEGDDIRTGVTAIIPGSGNLYTHPVPGWIHVGNGYGKLIGETQVRELGEIETPILLTCTLCVWSAANALKDWVYEQPGMGEHTVNPIVGETNDARVNNMWADPVQREHVFEALSNANEGPVAEGSVGAGRPRETDSPVSRPELVNTSMSPLFAATAEATEEAIYNAIFKATTVTSSRGTRKAIPVDKLQEILEKYKVLEWDASISPGDGGQ